MDSRLAILIAALIVTWLLACDSADRRPNVILVSIDTLRADHVGAYGYPRPTTPILDRFARDAVRFETCVAHAPSTLLSHASMLTSLLPAHHGASVLPPSPVSSQARPVAEELRRAGYRTASFNGGIQLDRAFGLDRGFDRYDSVKERGTAADALAGPENRFEAIVRRAIAWLDRAPEPFFLFLHTYEVHHPYTPDARHLEALGAKIGGDWPTVITLKLLKQLNDQREVDESELRRVIDAYDAEIRSVDEAFGRFLSHLEERGLYDGALIIVTSDHGEEFGEHQRIGWHSHTLYDELLLVPLLVKLPGSESAGQVVAGQVRGIDLAPTILAAARLEIPATYLGSDLSPAIARGRAERRPALSQRVPSPIGNYSALRLDNWKLDRRFLYDLQNDPGEQADAAERYPKLTRMLRELRRELLEERSVASRTPAPVPPEVLERLSALGYIE